MNEQLIVKNFGPIKDATVDFKRVTVFIGPTGGGKSTLAKLKDIFCYRKNYIVDDSSKHPRFDSFVAYKEHSLINYFSKNTSLNYNSSTVAVEFENNEHYIGTKNFENSTALIITQHDSIYKKAKQAEALQKEGQDFTLIQKSILEELSLIIKKLKNIESGVSVKEEFPTLVAPNNVWYCPSERIFISSLEYSWAGLLRDDIGLPRSVLAFANSFSLSRKNVTELDIPLFNVKYYHVDGRDFIKIPEREELLMLPETASGIQSVTPMLVLIEDLSRQQEQAQSFIIEEPELNLYPTAQQGLMNWLVEKCTKGENDLTITTHSPYTLASCNLLIEAYKVWQERPELEAEIEKIVPRTSWINPEEFAAYYVANGTVRSIQDERTDLVGGNELDAVSGQISDAFRSLLRLKKQPVNA